MPLGRWIVLACIVACFSPLASAQGRCEPISAPLSQCESVIAGEVYVLDDTTMEETDQIVSLQTGPFRLGLTPKACSDAAMKYICARAFPLCSDDTGSEILTPVCGSACDEFSSECGAILQAQGQPLPDCTLFPEDACHDAELIAPYREIPRATCEPAPELLPESQCHGYVDYDVYVPDGLSVEILDQLAGEKTGPFRIGLVPGACREAAMEFICAEAFRRCHFESVSPSVQVLLPSSTCERACSSFAGECGPILTAVGMDALVPDCAATSPLSGAPLYPTNETVIPVTAISTAVIECNALSNVRPYVFLPTATCQRFSGTQWSQCENVVEWELVYVTEGNTQRQLDYDAYTTTRPFTYANVDESCTAAMMRFTCSGLFVQCTEVDVPGIPGVKLALPHPPCQAVCFELVRECQETFEGFGVTDLIPDCVAVNPLTGQNVFPVDDFIIPLGDTLIPLPCTYPNVTVPVYRDCPGDFSLHKSFEVQSRCEFPCPVPIYSDGQNLAMKITISINTVLTLLFSTLLIVTFILDRAKRRFPEGLPIWLGVSAFGFGLGFFFGVIVGFELLICADSKFWCKTQATFLVYFQYGLAGWMTVIAFNMFLLFACKVPRKTARKLAPLYHIFAWGIGIPPIIVGLAIDRFTYIPPQLLCFISAETDGWPQLALYSFPVFTLCMLTVLFISGLILRLAMIAYQHPDKSFLRLMHTYWRIFLFIGLFLYIFFYNIEESIRAAATYDHNLEGFMDWGVCVFQNDGSAGCEFDVSLHFAPSFIFALNTSAQGWLVCLIFLTTPSSISFWRHFPRRFLSLVTGKGFYSDMEDKDSGTVTSQ